MSQPSKDEVVAGFEAIAKDASSWRKSSYILETAAANARSYTLTGFHFGYLADDAGVTRKYAEVQELAVRLLSEGAAAMQELADILISIIDDYHLTDTQVSGDFTTIGEPN